ncbi:MAG: hypothetical protein IJ446_01410 [Oscillospiraceae bacterium]|nr:hypothetical protein [Oscillospiraceae bacterium]
MERFTDKTIIKKDNTAIYLKNGLKINFYECNSKWNDLKNSSGKCIGERNITAAVPYFVFYSDNKLIRLEVHGLFRRRKFNAIRQHIEKSGYSTYDLS